MVTMSHSPSTFKLGLEFNAFLFAPIWEDVVDGPPNLASALARLDIDPWREAAELALLGEDAAIRRLVSRLAEVPAEVAPQPDLRTIATRLVALLPSRTVRPNLPPAIAGRLSMPQLLVFVVICLITLGNVVVMANRGTGPRPAASLAQPAAPAGPSKAHP